MELKDALAGYADWLGYRHAERAGAWLGRLELNRPELEAFRAAATPPTDAYVRRPCAVAEADGVWSRSHEAVPIAPSH